VQTAAGANWQLFDLSNDGSFLAGLAHVDYSSLGSRAPGLSGSFKSSTGELSIVVSVSRAILLGVGLVGLRRRRMLK